MNPPSGPEPPWLLLVAAPSEARAVLAGLGADPELANKPWELHSRTGAAGGFEFLVSGIGKVNAAGALARFGDPGRHGALLNLGLAGALPGSGLGLGDVVIGNESVYGDEGVMTPDGFMDCAAMGFPLGPFSGSAIPGSPELVRRLAALAARTCRIATVSTCSGLDRLAAGVRERTGADAECMEGAAAAHIACRLGIPFAEVRVISNTTGDRPRQVWDLAGGLRRLGELAGDLARLRGGAR